jgi:hypothetical protein
VTAAVLVVALTACRSFQPVPVTHVVDTKPDLVYLTDRYGRVQAIASPELTGDTLRGISVEKNRAVEISLRDVEQVAALRPSPARTALLIGGFAAVSAMVTYAIITRANGDGSQYCDYDIPAPGTECGYPGEKPSQSWGW